MLAEYDILNLRNHCLEGNPNIQVAEDKVVFGSSNKFPGSPK